MINPIEMVDYKLETKLGGRVAGVDEVGRGAWLGLYLLPLQFLKLI